MGKMRKWEEPPWRQFDEADDDARLQDAESHFANYQAYNQTLRTWYVGFGLGVPALALGNNGVGEPLRTAGSLWWIVGLCLLGSLAQVIGVLINKWVAWYQYVEAEDPDYPVSRVRTFFAKISDDMYLDFKLDVFSGLLFLIAIGIMGGSLILG